IGKGTDIPIVHTVELIDWATGGPMPAVLEGRTHQRTPSVAAPIAREASPI
ncbi:MAG TPA: glycolate oxidase iron-sulfur subunit, partial [Beijerinckiaceae bacterium]|nr:glycolate oxidase iron-sulfur subunit [Beijerinckiaceae bacterium]